MREDEAFWVRIAWELIKEQTGDEPIDADTLGARLYELSRKIWEGYEEAKLSESRMGRAMHIRSERS